LSLDLTASAEEVDRQSLSRFAFRMYESKFVVELASSASLFPMIVFVCLIKRNRSLDNLRTWSQVQKLPDH